MDYCTNRDEKCDRMKYAETYQYMNERGEAGVRCPVLMNLTTAGKASTYATMVTR